MVLTFHLFVAKILFLCLYSLLPEIISTGSSAVMPVIKYNNADLNKLEILKENKGKYDVYRWTNLVNGKNYVGSSTNLERRLINYFTISCLEYNTKKRPGVVFTVPR